MLFRNKRFLISGQVFHQSSWKLVQNGKDYTYHQSFKILLRKVWNEGPSMMSLSEILQSSFKAIYCNQTIESSRLGAMYIFWGEKFDCSSFFQNLEIQQYLWRHKVKIGPKKDNLYKKIKVGNWIFWGYEFIFETSFSKLILWPIPNTLFWRQFKIGSKEA